MTTKKIISPKTKEGLKVLKDLGQYDKTKQNTTISIVTKLEKLGYQWDNDCQLWINTNTQTTIYIKTDSTIASELIEGIREFIANFELAELELKGNPVITNAQDKDKKNIEGMKKCYLVYTNNSLNDIIEDDEDEIIEDN